MITLKQLRQFAQQQRKKLTPSEAVFQKRLDAAKIEHKNHPIVGFYIPDFIIQSRLLVVEIDGGYHMELDQVAYDQRKDAFMEGIGFRVVRIKNSQVAKWPLSRLKDYPVRPFAEFQAAWNKANEIRGNKKNKVHKRKTKRQKSIEKNKKLMNTLADILDLEKQLCCCLDAYKGRGDEDPACQAHEWAREIRVLMAIHRVSLVAPFPQREH